MAVHIVLNWLHLKMQLKLHCTMQILVFHILLGLLVVPNAHSSVPVTDFFPYGAGNGDSQLPVGDDDFVKVSLRLASVINIFNATYNSLFVNNNGAISFTEGVSQFTPNCKPLSKPMIVPFWADVDTTNGGTVHYRETTDKQFLQKANVEIRMGFENITNINLGWAFVATWDNVAFYGANIDCDGRTKRNTFQTILTTDGTHSFVIFFYNTVTWTTGIASNGNCVGLGGTPAKAGFDTGDGNTFSGIAGSCTDAVRNIETTTNVAQPGKWMFKIDNELQNADCPKSTLEQLKITPSFVTALGNSPITIEGPSLVGNTGLLCQFNDKTAQTVNAVMSSNKVAICNVPYLHINGRVKVDLLVTRENGVVDTFSGYVYTMKPNQLKFSLTDTFEYTMSWDRSIFGATTLKLNLELIELVNGVWTSRGIVEEGILNAGAVAGSLNSQGVTAITNLKNVYVVKLSSQPTLGRSAAINVESIVSSLQTAMQDKTAAEIDRICYNWYINDSGAPTDVEPCPLTLVQARADDRFEEVDDLSTYNPGAQYGFRQRVPSASGAGQRCTYKGGQIIVSSPGGGNVRKFSPNNRDTLLQHAVDDIAAWYTCCKWTTNRASCDYYNKRRPINSGGPYIPNPHAQAIGDPHITTFDGVFYHFYGVGQFWMIRDDSFSLQAKTFRYGSTSLCTDFVLQQRNGPNNFVNIQLSIKPNTIEITLDGDKVMLDDLKQPVRTIMYNGASIHILAPKRVKITFSSGYTFDFRGVTNAINIVAGASANLKGKIKGLLGLFDGDYSNDLTLPNGQVVNPRSTSLQLHSYGMQWSVDVDDDLFGYQPCRTFDDYQNVNFVPDYQLKPNISVPQEAVNACRGNEACLYDLYAAGDVDFAMTTLEAIEEFKKTQEILNEVVGICPRPIEPENGYLQLNNYLLNSTATVVCNANHKVDGNGILTCVKDSRGEHVWNGAFGKCIHVCTNDNKWLQVLCEAGIPI